MKSVRPSRCAYITRPLERRKFTAPSRVRLHFAYDARDNVVDEAFATAPVHGLGLAAFDLGHAGPIELCQEPREEQLAVGVAANASEAGL